MTVNVYKFYGNEVACDDVASRIEKYRKSDSLRMFHRIVTGRILVNRAFFTALMTLVLSVFSALMLVKAASNILTGALIFFALCMYGALFFRYWHEYSRKKASAP